MYISPASGPSKPKYSVLGICCKQDLSACVYTILNTPLYKCTHCTGLYSGQSAAQCGISRTGTAQLGVDTVVVPGGASA